MRIDVPKEFAACVRSIGGVILDDVLTGASKPSNADYWFPKYQVIAELKCLTENLMTKPEFNQRLSRLHSSWVKRGLIPISSEPKLTLNLRDIPTTCAREFLDPIKRRLEVNTFKKANAQIKALRKHLDTPNARGLLLLVNDGDYAFPPGMMCHLLARSMKSQHSSINSVIYFSVNEPVTVPGVMQHALFWIDAVLPNRESVDKKLREEIRSAWMSHHSGLIPDEHLYEIEMKRGPAVMDGMQFSKKGELKSRSSRPFRLRRAGS